MISSIQFFFICAETQCKFCVGFIWFLPLFVINLGKHQQDSFIPAHLILKKYSPAAVEIKMIKGFICHIFFICIISGLPSQKVRKF